MARASAKKPARPAAGVRRADARFGLDAAFALLLLLVMLDRYTGNAAHELLGVLCLAAIAAHFALNAKWFSRLPRDLVGGKAGSGAGRGALERRFRLAAVALIDGALLASFVLSMWTGILISQTLFIDFIPFEWQGDLEARVAHVQWSFWCFLLFGLHAGVHWEAIAGWLGKRLRGVFAKRPSLRLSPESRAALGFVLTLWGLAALEVWQIPAALAGYSSFVEWDAGDNAFLMTLDFSLVVFAWAWIAHQGKRLAKRAMKRLRA